MNGVKGDQRGTLKVSGVLKARCKRALRTVMYSSNVYLWQKIKNNIIVSCIQHLSQQCFILYYPELAKSTNFVFINKYETRLWYNSSQVDIWKSDYWIFVSPGRGRGLQIFHFKQKFIFCSRTSPPTFYILGKQFIFVWISKDFWQRLHIEEVFSPWLFMWVLKSRVWKKNFTNLHIWGFWEKKNLSHNLHLWGLPLFHLWFLSSEWNFSCLVSLPSCVHLLSQNKNTKGVSPILWVAWCCFKNWLEEN